MREKIEGTISLDGLIEGRLPDDPDIEGRLQEWVSSVASLGLEFQLDITGDGFNLLPDEGPYSTQKLGSVPDQVISQALERLLGAFPASHRRKVFSTLRSSEFRKGEEVQAIYAVGPDGSVKARSRVVATETTAGERPLATREKVKLGLLGIVAALAIFGVLSFFIDIRGLATAFFEGLRRVDPEEITTDATAFADLISVENVKGMANPKALVMALTRGRDYPVGEEALSAAWERTRDSLPARLAVEALARGYVRCELHDGSGKFVTSHPIRVRELETRERIEVILPLPKKIRVARVVLRY